MKRFVVGMLAAAASALAMPTAWADPPGRVGRIAATHGTVWIYAPDQQEWVQAEVNRPLTTGDRLALDHDARAEVTIGSTTVRLDGDSQLDLTELDDEHMRLQLDQGAIAARLRDAQAATQFEVTTPQGRFMPQQPGHYRIDIDDDETLALAWSGSLRFDASDSALTIPAGQRAELWQEDGATHYSWAGVPHDDFSDWALAADERDEQAAARQRYVPLDMTGWEDLDRAGRWESTTEYGAVWIPLQVAPGWAPYQQGHWVWMSPWGWTWVDDAPWGFAPFHYGRWVWWGQRWCWVPGRHRHHLVYAPALVGWVGASPAYTGVGPAPLVGWVPLAPGEVYYPGYAVGPGHWHALNPHDPRKSYRPAPPPRRNANFVNGRAPGALTLVPAASFAQARPSIGVAARDPRDHHVPQPPRGGRPGSGAGTPGVHEGPGSWHGNQAGGGATPRLAVAAPPPAPSRAVSGAPAAAVPAPPNVRRRAPFVRPPASTQRPAISVPAPSSRPAVSAPSVPPRPAAGMPSQAWRPPGVHAPGDHGPGAHEPGGREDHPVPVIRPAPGRQAPAPSSAPTRPEDGHRTSMPVPHPQPARPAPAPRPPVHAPPARPLPVPPQMPPPQMPPRPPGVAPATPPRTGALPPSSIVTRVAPAVVAPQVVAPAHPPGGRKPQAPADDDPRPHAPPGRANAGTARQMQP